METIHYCSSLRSNPASAVSKHDNLEFLSDVVPNTIAFKDYNRMRKAKAEGIVDPEAITNGQQTLAFAQKPGETDEAMVEEDDGRPHTANGNRLSLGSEAGPSTARHSYDAVRNTFGPAPEAHLPMEED